MDLPANGPPGCLLSESFPLATITLKEIATMAKAVKYVEKAAVYASQGAWAVFERLNRISPNPGFIP